MRIELTDDEIAAAEVLANARRNEAARRHSPDRPTSKGLVSQRRGAIGELVAAKYLRQGGLSVEAGFEEDLRGHSDLTAGGCRIEVMTAQIAHRAKTGFCVPPNKLWAARQREAMGYLFVGTGPEDHPRGAWIQGGVRLENVDADPPRDTFVSNPKYAVQNHVIRESDMLQPAEFLELLREW